MPIRLMALMSQFLPTRRRSDYRSRSRERERDREKRREADRGRDKKRDRDHEKEKDRNHKDRHRSRSRERSDYLMFIQIGLIVYCLPQLLEVKELIIIILTPQ